MADIAYTPEELATLAAAVMLTGMAVSIVDAGIVSTAVEANAMAQEIAGAAQKYPNNSLIQALFSTEAIKKARQEGTLKIVISPEEVQPATAVGTAIARINAALALLQGRSQAEEIAEYKEFIYACADRVANAAGSGLFGTGSPKISDKEAAALAQIKTALQL